MSDAFRILLIDDDAAGRSALSRALRSLGYQVEAHAAGPPALESLAEGEPFDMVITDIKMPDMDGMEVLAEVHRRHAGLPVILITAFGTIENAVEAMAQGATDYLTKPLSLPEVRSKVARALEGRRLERENQRLNDENARLKEEVEERQGLAAIIGSSAVMQRLGERLRQVARTPSSVLVIGESGTGKELIARAVHDESPRRDRPFLPINCAAIPRDILESELFGHERGAFTGAVGRKPGKFEVANTGTLFLDEVGELPLDMQAKLLRVLEEKAFMRVGGVDVVKVDVRIVAATNARLEQLVEKGDFRADLYYRLKVITLDVPPLRRRPEDIPALVEHFLKRLGREYQRQDLRLTSEALQALQAQRWPGNVRELRNMLESVVVLSSGARLGLADLPPEYGGAAAEASSPAAPAPSLIEEEADGDTPAPAAGPTSAAPGGEPTYEAGLPMAELEKRHILKTLAEQGHNRTRAARVLGIGRRTLQRKLEEYKEAGEEIPPPAPD